MDTAHYKTKLEQELELVTRELKSMGAQNPTTGEWEAKETDMDTMSLPADANEAADKIEEYDENRALEDELQIRWRDIKDALKRIEDGTYGKCEECGKEIEPDRLEANPAARTCKAHM
ncbi:MAG: TraR/DksA C4-type zinc finger protein [Patescibacteria group bacterium]|nr:TraR/DksA C4-type zinc finger protein [Patescibacteria group bacterium]